MDELRVESVATVPSAERAAARHDVAAAATRESARAKLFGEQRRQRVEVGRYIVERKLGAGGMGEVFLAHDPELDRKVALKLVTPGVGTSPQANARLLREARALARLDHPNTVPVHDVGTSHGRVWLAMEFIDGITLCQWLESAPRPFAAVAQVFAAAARGLAAAHSVGLLHRDFKPDNVMVAPADAERPGSVRVTDFGLAASLGEQPTSEGIAEPLELAQTLTRAGVVQGTVGYIAPELLEGGRPSPASDQFAFCVSLYEALWGERPFTGPTPLAILMATTTGAIRPPPRGRGVPAWARRLVLRGLAVDPEQRFPSMEVLARQLIRDRTPWRRNVIGVALAGASVTGVVIATRPPPCPSDPARLHGVWDDARREAIHDAFLATGAPYAQPTFVHVAQQLDDWVNQWSTMRQETCEATHVRNEQSERLLDLRMACLDAELAELRELTGALADGDAETVRRAGAAMGSLPRISRCADRKGLETTAAAIENPAQAELATRAEEALAQQRALSAVGRYDAAAEASARARDAAEGSGHGPTIAEVLMAAGLLEFQRGHVEQAERELTDAVWQAEGSSHDRVAALATAHLVALVGYQQARPERGLEWADHCAALVRRIGGDPEIEATRHAGLGHVRDGQGRPAEARAEYEEALALRRSIHGDDHVAVADALYNLGSAAIAERDLTTAEAYYSRALQTHERTVGKAHPDYATTLGNLGIVAHEAGRVDEALSRYREALAILEAAVGPDHFDALIIRNNVVRAELARGDLDAALELGQQSVADATRVLGERHPDTLRARGTLTQVLEARGDHAAARRLLEETIAAGGNEAILDDMRLHLAFAMMEAEEPARAVELLEAARRGKETRDPGGASLVDVQEALVLALLLLGRNDDAKAEARRSLDLARRHGRLEEIVRTRLADAPQLAGDQSRTLTQMTLAALSSDAAEARLAREIEAFLAPD